MAFSRKQLKAMGLTDEQVESVTELHLETVDPLKKERDTYKEDAEKLPGVQAELDKLKGTDGGYKEKYEAEKTAHDALKQQIETDKTNAGKKTAVRKLIKDSGVNRAEFVELLLTTVNMDQVEMEGDQVKNPDAIISPMKTAYSSCFGTVTQVGTPTANPPAGSGSGKTKAEIMKIKDHVERQKAIAENIEQFRKE